MQAAGFEIFNVTYCIGILLHGLYGCRLIVITSQVHALYTQSFIVCPEFYLGEIRLLLSGRFLDCPVKVFLLNEVRQSDYGYEVEVFLAAVIYA